MQIVKKVFVWKNINLTYVNIAPVLSSTSAWINVNVATSRAALLDKPPPIGTFVMITASNPGKVLSKQYKTPFM